ncbi:hypothetical protein BsWGS_21492 [Bradybaena similaris]
MSKDKTRQEARQDMYKYNGRSPGWKDKFRMRCFERLKDSRGRHMSSKRPIDSLHATTTSSQDLEAQERSDSARKELNVRPISERIPEIDMIMREEFARLKSEMSSATKRNPTDGGDFQKRANVCDAVNANADDNSSMEVCRTSVRFREDNNTHLNEHENECLSELISWYEEVYQTLRSELQEAEKKEEALRVSQHLANEYLKYEEGELCSGMRALYCEEVCCPLCEKSSLVEQKNMILCRCGLSINVEQDSITLKNVKDNLAAGTEEHSQKCESKPAFSLNQKFGISNLLMSCQDCDFLFVIV